MITLLPHQSKAVEWLMRRGGSGLIHIFPGGGKTYIACEVLRRLNYPRTLIIVPKSVLLQWKSEILNYDTELLKHVLIINYESLTKVSPLNWRSVVLDESSYIKNPTAKRTKMILGSLSYVPHKILLSGTPAPNYLHEFYPQITFLDPHAFNTSSWWQFRAAWCRTLPYIPQKIIGYNNEERLRQIISSYCFRVKSGDGILKLPDVSSYIEYVLLSKKERRKYERLRKEGILLLKEEKISVPNVLAKLVYLRLLASGSRIYGGVRDSAKKNALGRLLRDDRRTIVFTEFSTIASELAQEFGGLLYTGSTSISERDDVIQGFLSDKMRRPLFMTAAGSLGLNLQGAERVIHFDLPWNRARLEQRLARMVRHGARGKKEEVILIVQDTVDDYMFETIKDKERKLTAHELYKILQHEFVL